jgi:protein involved in polysaccharide export with SLBB domain
MSRKVLFMSAATRFVRLLLVVVTLGVVFSTGDTAYGQNRDEKERDEDARTAWDSSDSQRWLPPLEGAVDADTYVLGPWDELLLIVKGPSTRVHTLRVLPEGNVILPDAGAVRAAGYTLADFREKVRKDLRQYYRNVEIDCQLAWPGTFSVYVLGQVEKPRAVDVVAPFRVSHAVDRAGGIAKSGSSRLIEIRESGNNVRTVDLFHFFRYGDFENNPILREGYSVYVPAKRAEVVVLGEVRLPDRYELVPGETAADLIEHAGGLRPDADPENLLLERFEDNGASTRISLDTADQYVLNNGDAVVVPDMDTYEEGNAVLVTGGGGRQGWLAVGDNESLSEFLPRLWRFEPQFDIETAIHERDVPGNSPVQTTFNVHDVIAGSSLQDFTLTAGDIITFPSMDYNVYVAGEVNAPGEFPFVPGRSAARYITLAGGPKDGGSFDRLTIFSADGEKRSGGRGAIIYRGDTVVVNRGTSRIVGTVFLGLTSLTSLVLAIVAVTK